MYLFVNMCGCLFFFFISFCNFNYNVVFYKYLDLDFRVGSKINKEM